MNNHQNLILRVYLYLILLTAVSAFMGTVEGAWLQGIESIALTGVLILTVIKGLQIVDVYMELKHAPALWRNLLRGYVIVIPVIIGIIYIVF